MHQKDLQRPPIKRKQLFNLYFSHGPAAPEGHYTLKKAKAAV